jgi:hypothetical protein
VIIGRFDSSTPASLAVNPRSLVRAAGNRQSRAIR